MERLYEGIEPMRGAVELVERLQSCGVRMAIATSSVRKSFDTKMKHHPRILAAMEVVVTGDDPLVRHGKPAPDIFLEAARRLSASTCECVAFEDSPHGIAAAREAGMYAVAIPDARLPGNDFSQAHRVLGSLEEWLAELSPHSAACGRDADVGTAGASLPIVEQSASPLQGSARDSETNVPTWLGAQCSFREPRLHEQETTMPS